uniref:Uncharacterized protein n=1 Tax=Myoviridae sp. ctZiv5 TaxID=2827289 RepID=A0A8S5R4I1_9CAUD|nr:MAG TPA: hypothetical protein [Myoviridae sp. ctZiv5]
MHISYVYYLYNFTILTVNIQLSMSTFLLSIFSNYISNK